MGASIVTLRCEAKTESGERCKSRVFLYDGEHPATRSIPGSGFAGAAQRQRGVMQVCKVHWRSKLRWYR
jgi:hypothetical protein